VSEYPRYGTPLPLPQGSPDAEPLLYIPVNSDWIRFLLGMVEEFKHEVIWNATDAERDLADRWIDVLLLLIGTAKPLEGQLLRVGDIVMCSQSDIGAGRLICNGAVYARTDEPDLYDAIDPAYRIDADFFRVPDFTGRFPRGNSVAIEGGYSEIELPEHRHQTVRPVMSQSRFAADPNGTENAVTALLPTMTGATGSNIQDDNLPPYHGVVFCIVSRSV